MFARRIFQSAPLFGAITIDVPPVAVLKHFVEHIVMGSIREVERYSSLEI